MAFRIVLYCIAGVSSPYIFFSEKHLRTAPAIGAQTYEEHEISNALTMPLFH